VGTKTCIQRGNWIRYAAVSILADEEIRREVGEEEYCRRDEERVIFALRDEPLVRYLSSSPLALTIIC
jgi:hypothetical protein